MRGVALLLLLLATGGALQGAHDDEQDDDSDVVPYMVIVEHADGWRCAAALVSQRTALSSARCARPRAHPRPHADLWALAPARCPPAHCARRVARTALAGDGRDPEDPALDLALLELDEPFGERARARPVLMATAAGACAVPDCYTARVLPRATAGARLRVVSLRRAEGPRCARVPHWGALGGRALCLLGDALCDSETGGGVVCAGLLCAVLTAPGAGGDGDAGGARCGDTHGALAVPPWRHFLHCAHTPGLCGRGDCKSVCTEQGRGDDEAAAVPPRPTSPPPAPSTPRPAPTKLSLTLPTHTHVVQYTVGVERAGAATGPRRTAPVSAPLRTAAAHPPHLGHYAAFEPFRADFKAGEYGDNAAEYGAPPDEPPPPTLTSPSPCDTPPPRNVTAPPSPSARRRLSPSPQRLAEPDVDPLAQPQQEPPKTSRASQHKCTRKLIVSDVMLLITVIVLR